MTISTRWWESRLRGSSANFINISHLCVSRPLHGTKLGITSGCFGETEQHKTMTSGPIALCAKMFVNLTPGIDFNNIWLEAFTCENPQSVKNSVKLSVSFCAFGICECKDASKMLMKLTLGLHKRGGFKIQCPPLNRITLCQHKSDNNNRMILCLCTVEVQWGQ